MKSTTTLLLWVLLSSLSINYTFAQDPKATIIEEKKQIPTYPYSDPNPIPILGDNDKIYPYFKFQGYSHKSELKEWKVVKLENDYIEVYVLPEIGGKVYGAIEKSTGEEFIYMNKVIKFRDIAMRGPWTSGGIEFNFGIIGHTPSTASYVDYQLVENEDGSVSCFVGNLDLPSRTHWSVEIRLPNDKAYFETKVHWFNPTPLHQSYYNYMTGAAPASKDLEFFSPGNTYLTHSGDPLSWPYHESGKHISEYKNNNFGSSKSYHVVGEYQNYFGGYFHEKNFGFGHWALHEEMPGQKLWLWDLSRSGGIWENLLTDKDGQYIEFQAGRQLNQYSPNHNNNPITQVPFYPHTTDSWREIWFPIKETGGISAVSPQAVMHVIRSEDSITVKINALAAFKSDLIISSDGKKISTSQLEMKPMAVSTITIPNQKGDLKIIAPNADLIYHQNPQNRIRFKKRFHPKI